MPRAAIEFKHVGKTFPARRAGETPVEAVRDVNVTVYEGEVVSLIGPSGCGKSTLLNMGSGLYLPTTGEVDVAAQRVTGPNPQVAFMLQKDLLLPWRSIRENAELGLEIRGAPSTQRRERAKALLAKCHLSAFEDHYPHQLSGGMRQRAALARTLAVDPLVLLMDEPFSALDAQTKMILQQDPGDERPAGHHHRGDPRRSARAQRSHRSPRPSARRRIRREAHGAIAPGRSRPGGADLIF
jgi:NitT/TauT family transport system ATP-binding protein